LSDNSKQYNCSKSIDIYDDCYKKNIKKYNIVKNNFKNILNTTDKKELVEYTSIVYNYTLELKAKLKKMFSYTSTTANKLEEEGKLKEFQSLLMQYNTAKLIEKIITDIEHDNITVKEWQDEYYIMSKKFTSEENINFLNKFLNASKNGNSDKIYYM